MRTDLISAVQWVLRASNEKQPVVVADYALSIALDEDAALRLLVEADGSGLCNSGLEHCDSSEILVSAAGLQFLEQGGQFESEVLSFLPDTIDNLFSREALIAAGSIMIDDFRAELLDGRGIQHAKALVPPAFKEAVDDVLALDLLMATTALMVRLSDNQSAGCVAEEIIAFRLVKEAAIWLDIAEQEGDITANQSAQAQNDLRLLYELFEDSDVLYLFEMTEPADAALAGNAAINQMMGIADQRIEAWFEPFGGVIRTGHISR
jgi:hypothetical protein